MIPDKNNCEVKKIGFIQDKEPVNNILIFTGEYKNRSLDQSYDSNSKKRRKIRIKTQ